MSSIRFGVILDDLSILRSARKDDPVDIVVARDFFRNPPRASGCRSVIEKVQSVYEKAAVVPYAWQYITHTQRDGVPETNRRPDGDASEAGHFRVSRVVEHAWSVTDTAIQALGSKAVIFRTPPSFTPGSLNRKRFAAFLEKHRRPNHQIIWEHQGLWEQSEADALAAELGLIRMAEFSMKNIEEAQLAPTWFVLPEWESTHTLRDLIWELGADEDEEDSGPALTVLVSGPKALGRIRSLAKDMG